MENIKTILDLFSGLLVPVIAGITVYIAYQQYKTNKNRLKFELYDKRLKIYLSTKTIISKIVSEANISLDNISQFAEESWEAEFLFDKEIFEYLNTISKNAKELYAFHAQFKVLPSEDKQRS